MLIPETSSKPGFRSDRVLDSDSVWSMPRPVFEKDLLLARSLQKSERRHRVRPPPISDKGLGVFNESATVSTVDHSRVAGDSAAMFDASAGQGQFLVGASRLAGSVTGPARCVYVYDQDYMPLAADCTAVPP